VSIKKKKQQQQQQQQNKERKKRTKKKNKKKTKKKTKKERITKPASVSYLEFGVAHLWIMFLGHLDYNLGSLQ
jgi:hypothetical protein